MTAKKKYANGGDVYDPRVDPGKKQLTADIIGTGTDIAGSTLTGLKVGGVKGAAVGLGVGLLKAMSGRDDRVDAREDLTSDWMSRNVNTFTSNSKNFKSGGKIKGKGTAKSDDIKMSAEDGSFVATAENSGKAFALGKEFLGWTDSEVASRNGGEIDVNVSNGEVIFTPEEANKLSGMGINLEKELAPNAESGSTNLADGGDIGIEEIASGIQIAGGVAGNLFGKRRPDINVSSDLRALSAETVREAGYGLPPAVKNEMKKQNERTRRAVTNTIVNQGGPGQQQKLNAVLRGTLDKNLDIEMADFQAQEKKKATARGVKSKMADMDYLVQKDVLDTWKESKTGFNELLSAGISNIIGARQYKNEAEALKEARDKSINFTLPTAVTS